MIDYPNAVNELRSLFNTNFQTLPLTVLSYVPDIYWEGDEPVSPIDNSKFWVRFSERNSSNNQSSLRNDGLTKRYRNRGFVFVQVFCPKIVEGLNKSSFSIGLEIANFVKKIFQGHSTSDNIWFRETRVQTLDPENLWYRFNVIAEYQHDEEGS